MNEQNQPLLIIYKGALAGMRWPLGRDPVTLGRAPDCDIVLPERQISRYHVRIEWDADGYVLRDLGSKNGTLVNGEKVRGQLYRLRDGDEISLATTLQIGFVADEATLGRIKSAAIAAAVYSAGDVGEIQGCGSHAGRRHSRSMARRGGWRDGPGSGCIDLSLARTASRVGP